MPSLKWVSPMPLGMHRSNINRLAQPLIQQGLVRQKRCHITNEEGRVISESTPEVDLLLNTLSRICATYNVEILKN